MRIGARVGLAATIVTLVAVLTTGSTRCLYADQEQSEVTVTPLMQQAFPELPGKEALLLMVEFAPGHVDLPHRHDAHVFVYVLEGSVEMGVAGGNPVILKQGDTFYENPEDVHPVGRNMSKSKPAKLLVFFVKSRNTPPVLPAKS